ncbi:MAG: response regulator, partial [Pseudomonadota bacterium]
AEISQRQTTAGQGESFHKNSKMRSLWIIDDDQTISEALSLAVTKWKMRITCMTSVAEVSQRLHKEPAPDAALIDYDLGHSLNGLDAANVIRHLNTTSKIVIVTGNSDRQTIEKIEESGFPCLLKPVDTKAIARALNITAIE